MGNKPITEAVNKSFTGIKVAILTISDRCSRGEMQDKSGPVIREEVERLSGEIVSYEIVPDEVEIIKKKLIIYSNELKVNLVLTTGGTGLSPRDVTPEAIAQVIEREIPGISEFIRFEGLKYTKTAMLSRAKSGIIHKTLIINLPGNSNAVKESMDAILDVIPHALEMMDGKGHPDHGKK